VHRHVDTNITAEKEVGAHLVPAPVAPAALVVAQVEALEMDQGGAPLMEALL
jgi:hypothetical protein